MSVLFRLLVIAAAMSAVLAGMVASHAHRRETGVEVVLDMRPVDPRDFLAGHYVIVTTDLHLLDSEDLGGDDAGFRSGRDVFVIVAEGSDGVWRPVSVHLQRPADGVFLHGKVRLAFPSGNERTIRVEDGEGSEGGGAVMTVASVFNLERYYADAGTARALELLMQEQGADDDARLQLIVSVPADGGAVIRGLIVDGERRYDRLF